MHSEWVADEQMTKLLGAMMPANRLAIEVSMATGLRISDVLALTREQVAKGRFFGVYARLRPARDGLCASQRRYNAAVWTWQGLYMFSRLDAMQSVLEAVRRCTRTL